MSDFRSRAADVKAAGEAARGDFTPDGVPKRMYQWWLANSPGKKAQAINDGTRRENFCHFWRVVVFWVPMLALLISVVSVLEWVADRVPGPVAVIALGLLLFGALSTVLTLNGGWIEFLTVLGISVGVLAVAVGVVVGGERLSQRFEWFLPGVVIAMGSAVILFALYLAVSAFGFVFFAWLAAGAAVAGIAGFGLFKMGERIQAKRAYKKAQAQKAEDEAYDAWIRGEGPSPFERTRKFRTPSAFELKLAAFFSGIGDFLVLATQVVRVNKWKICPLVEVEPVERTPADF